MDNIDYYKPDPNTQYYVIEYHGQTPLFFAGQTLETEINLIRYIRNQLDEYIQRASYEEDHPSILNKIKQHDIPTICHVQEPEIRQNRIFASSWQKLTAQDILDFYFFAKKNAISGDSYGIYVSSSNRSAYKNRPTSHTIRQWEKSQFNVSGQLKDFSKTKSETIMNKDFYGNIFRHYNRLRSLSSLPDCDYDIPRAKRSSGWKNTSRLHQYKTKQADSTTCF